MRLNRLKERSSIILPPLILLMVGIGVYIAVVKFTTPEERIITVSSEEETEPSSSPTPSPLQQPSMPGIQLQVPEPSTNNIESWQENANNGQESWRTNPLDVAEQTAGQYGFLIDDQLTLVLGENGQAPSGQATVLAVNNGLDYEIFLTQPSVQGKGGIWIISDINAVN